MMHAESTTRSPSSFSFTRSTPWVEGCCGPIFKIISSAPSTVVLTFVSSVVRGSLICLLSALNPQILANPIRILLQYVVILAQRISLPFIRHQNASQLRMAFEHDSEHVVAFALQPVCRGPDFANARHGFVFGGMRFQAHALVLGKGIQNQNHIESFFALGPVHCG